MDLRAPRRSTNAPLCCPLLVRDRSWRFSEEKSELFFGASDFPPAANGLGAGGSAAQLVACFISSNRSRRPKPEVDRTILVRACAMGWGGRGRIGRRPRSDPQQT